MFNRITHRQLSHAIILIKIILVIVIGIKLVKEHEEGIAVQFDSRFFLFFLAGFIAEIIDGSMGMAYGVICSSMLIFFGVPPALTSASVHTAEVFTTGVSGLSHLHFRNVDFPLFWRLVIPGVVGSVLGAVLISKFLEGDDIKPFISVYLFILGLRLIYIQYYRFASAELVMKGFGVLGFFGGALDAIGGGGWGPVVSSSVLNKGGYAPHVIGTVNTAEFFITFSSTGVFLMLVGVHNWDIILGLILGGVLAAPLGAYFVKIVPHRVLIFIVAAILMIISSLTLYYHFAK